MDDEELPLPTAERRLFDGNVGFCRVCDVGGSTVRLSGSESPTRNGIGCAACGTPGTAV